MALHEVTQEIRSTLYSWYNSATGQKTKRSYYKYIAMGLGAAILAGGFYLAYSWYVSYRERSAQRIFAQYINEYRRAHQQDLAWGATQDLFQLGAEQHGGSYLHPYFLVFQADALIKEGKKEEALATLDKAIAAMRNSDPVAPLFKMKHALVQIDMSDVQLQQAGLQSLISLANDESNNFRDAAQFFLGDYYWVQDDIQHAQTVWNELVESQHGADMITISPWAQRAQQKLAQIA
jgi:predicted negative regulator of RcsB-dependent stress response